MKTKYSKVARFIIILFIAGMVLPLCAQDYPDYITINGVVKDKKSKDKLEYVSISIPGTSIGTVTNEDGGFSIKVKDSLQAKVLELSRLGYANQRYSIKGNEDDITIFMTANDNKLKEVVIESVDPLELVKAAIGKIADNNSCNANLLTGFYRETVKKRRNYINISEAVVDVYKTPYDEDDSRDNIQVCKGRKLLSPKPSDTLIVKFLGGPNLSTYLDVVKNKDLMLNPETLSYYEFSIEDPVILNERLHYVVSFKPQVILPYALLYGKLYIDKQSLAFSRAEFSLSMDDQNKATEAILRKKPYRLRFKPEEVSYVVTYKEQNGRSYLNYIRNEIRFKCDWKRRLFSTNYTILLEMVMTERKEDHVERIPSKLLFNEKHSLSDKVGSFYDQDFWEDYNIIEPTESLESAVTKLKKQNK
ncbi:carboxypeptidase-like regulatory domain-containing protein [Dysgonomonas sp. ZJ279]|uniref:carboxypeptidase-like regulatory domain-containing protein n=1 Tax=Dysgonomonas sp. ZJ279 TaxID=2709796 RepID=UPI0013EBB5C7|nr:carboxypeptidase-like regulatory domain-containing protein [Dysgonomonas sp. ZJ279]